MKVYELFKDDCVGSIIAIGPFDHQTEIEVEAEEKDLNCTKDDIASFLKDCEELNVGEKASLECFTIKCVEMSQEEIDELPEWNGW